MGNRCPDCNKFVGLEMGDPEAEIEISNFGDLDEKTGEQEFNLSGDVRLVLNCGECSSEMKEASCEVDQMITFTHKNPKCPGVVELEVEAEGTARFTDAKNPRYVKHFYGAELRYKLTCPECGAEDEDTGSVECQASEFEDLN